MWRTIITTAAVALVILGVIFALTLFIGSDLGTEYIEFALALGMFVVIFVGAYWFVVRGQG
jgi:hypothetical protein